MDNEALIKQAKDWGFECDESKAQLRIAPSENEKQNWHLTWNGQYWVLFSQDRAAMNLCTGDVLKFLSQRKAT